jgi:ABC transporter fused permease/ATP-binding protein
MRPTRLANNRRPDRYLRSENTISTTPSKGVTWQRLYQTATPERRNIIIGLIFLAVSSGTSLLFPQIIRWMIDQVLQPKRIDLLLPAATALFGAFALLGIAGSVRYYLFTISGERIVLKLREQLYQRILMQDVAFFDANRTGDLMSRLSSDCTSLQNTVSVNVSQGLRNIAQVLGGFAFMFYTSWKLSALMLIMIPPVAGAAAIFGKKIRAYSKEFQNHLATAGTVAEETIAGVRTVKSFIQETQEAHRYDQALTHALTMAKSRIRAIAEFMTVAMLLGLGAICFVLWYGGREVILDRMSIGDITQFLMYLMFVAIGVGSLGSLWGDLNAGIGASKRVFELIEREPAVPDVGAVLPSVEGRIDFLDVRFSYPSRPDFEVLRGLTLRVEAGQAVALVGPSGGGKTTIANLIPRFYEPDSGRILIDGTPINTLRPSFLREHIGIVSQDPALISSTIRDNIGYGNPFATDAQIKDAAKAANALEFIERFPDGFQTLVGEKGIQLSGGQKQRVAIARAILKNPRILLLDEATSNLDTASESLVQEALQHLMRGRTTLLIAHRLATVKNADQIFVLNNGQIVQSGRHEELATQQGGLYYKLLQKQFIED